MPSDPSAGTSPVGLPSFSFADVFDQGVFTPDDRRYVRWHWAVKIPDTPRGTVKPGQTGVTMVPISSMVPRDQSATPTSNSTP